VGKIHYKTKSLKPLKNFAVKLNCLETFALFAETITILKKLKTTDY